MRKLKKKNKEKVDFKKNFIKYLKMVGGNYPLLILVLTILLVVEILMIADNLIIKELVDLGEKISSGAITLENATNIFLIILGIFGAIVLVRSSLRFLESHASNRIIAKIEQKIKNKYFKKVIEQDYEFHTNNKPGELISRLSRGGSAGANLMGSFFTFYRAIISLILVFLTIAFFSIIPAIITLITAVVIFSFSYSIFQKQGKAKIEHNKNEDKERGFVSNIISNFEIIKYSGKEKKINNSFKKQTNKTKETSILVEDHLRIFMWAMSFTLGISTLILLYFSFKDFLAGNISIGTVVFIFTTFGRMIQPVVSLTHTMGQINRNIADLQTLFEYDKIEKKINDKKGAKNFNVGEGKIEFREVSFSYEKTKVLKNFSLKIKPGEKIALVGESGSGKTSIIRLLFRLYEPDTGKILIDGNKISDWKQEKLRSQIGIVPQDTILFNDTLYNNIKFGNPSAPRKDVKEVIKNSELKEFVDKLEKKENTLVGERGIKLSGGEKQRVSIARAMLMDKKIIILDEPTSALDSKTEKKIHGSIKKLLKNRTAIIIAHRLSTIMDADKIIVLKEGKIVEQGTHEKLINNNGEYAHLWNLQKGGIIE